jgi:dihydrofolate synthase/folylpolyglutamate synthase
VTGAERNPGPDGATWTLERAESYLLGLELFGMRFGLDRMRRLLTTLGSPQERFASVHVVGTNGKSSTTRMIAAILEGHAIRTGAYLSPHLTSFAERVRIGDEDSDAAHFAAAVQRTARAAELVDRTSAGDDDHVTQFEALTAAAYWELARAGVDTAVIEAGLGGRWDATNVIPSSVQVLTNVGLEHTRWLGPTVAHIATEKLDVVRPGGTLVVGEGLHPDAMALAEQVCAERHATLVVASPLTEAIPPLRALGAYQRENFAVAIAAARAALAAREEPIALDPAAVAAAAAATLVPGRFQLVDTAPDTFVDGAHNPGGMAALAEAIAAVRGNRRTAVAVSVLDDKDAAGMLRELLPVCDLLVCTTNANPRSLSPATLASLAGQLGFPAVVCEPDPRAALRRARHDAGADGLAVAAGSIYLIADLLRPAGAGRASVL